jgi:hypothetical protein
VKVEDIHTCGVRLVIEVASGINTVTGCAVAFRGLMAAEIQHLMAVTLLHRT